MIPESSSTMTLTSSAFKEGGSIPAKYSCKGENINPPLSITGVPEIAQSLALVMEDPDAPNGTWDHWIVFNIDPKTTTIEEGREPKGLHGIGSSGNKEYKGPCPPGGIHRYFFTVYAVDSNLDLPEGVTKKDLLRGLQGHSIAEAKLMGKFSK
jgi:Raf kinase inhibitor-like YbhB/YbcL family protein